MHVSNDVIVRDGFGRFIADIECAAPRLIEDALGQGIAAARVAAPERTGRLKGSFIKVILSRTSGVFANTAPYAGAQDQGARPHTIDAHVSFFWDKMGRRWMWPEAYGPHAADPIQHPGNPATHFMAAGYGAIKRKMPTLLKKHYPG